MKTSELQIRTHPSISFITLTTLPLKCFANVGNIPIESKFMKRIRALNKLHGNANLDSFGITSRLLKWTYPIHINYLSDSKEFEISLFNIAGYTVLSRRFKMSFEDKLSNEDVFQLEKDFNETYAKHFESLIMSISMCKHNEDSLKEIAEYARKVKQQTQGT